MEIHAKIKINTGLDSGWSTLLIGWGWAIMVPATPLQTKTVKKSAQNLCYDLEVLTLSIWDDTYPNHKDTFNPLERFLHSGRVLNLALSNLIKRSFNDLQMESDLSELCHSCNKFIKVANNSPLPPKKEIPPPQKKTYKKFTKIQKDLKTLKK